MLNNSDDGIAKKVETYECLALCWSKKYAYDCLWSEKSVYDCLWQVCDLQIPKCPELPVISIKHELEKPHQAIVYKEIYVR